MTINGLYLIGTVACVVVMCFLELVAILRERRWQRWAAETPADERGAVFDVTIIFDDEQN